ncbi:hypothetical protein MASR1M45_30200 [Candidatus Kapaibacterium sp.]
MELKIIKNILILIATLVFLTTPSLLFSIENSNTQHNKLLGTEIVNYQKSLFVVNADTVTNNKITSVWYTTTELNVKIIQVLKQQEITIIVYNMLGKEILEVFKGTTGNNAEETYSKSSNLPNGIYICVMQGKSFRSSEKFIISR